MYVVKILCKGYINWQKLSVFFNLEHWKGMFDFKLISRVHIYDQKLVP
jgi:hypothetical protein